QQVGVAPQGIPAADAPVLGQGGPQRGGLPQAAGSQLQADQGGERLLGGTTGRAAAAERLGQPYHIGKPVPGGAVDDVADPSRDQREGGLQPGQRGLLLRRDPRGEAA